MAAFILDLTCIEYFSMKTIKIALITLTFGVLASCESNTYSEISTVNTNPTYAVDIAPIMTANCTSCHSVAGAQEPFLENYDQVKSAVENNGLISQIAAPTGSGMPENQRLPQAKIDAVTTWVANGFLN